MQNPLVQSPPAEHGAPADAAVQTPPTQLLLQQSVLLTQGFDGWTHAQVVLLKQNWLVQSPPAEQGLPTGSGRHVPLVQRPVQQSVLLTQAVGGWTHPQTLPFTVSQNLLQQSPPFTQLVPTCEHGTVVVVELTQTCEVENVDTEGQPGLHATPASQQVIEAPVPQGVFPAGQPQMPEDWSMQAMPLWRAARSF